MVEREYEEAGKQFKEKRFFINSIPPVAKTFAYSARGTGGLGISCIGGWISYFEKMPVAFKRETLRAL